MRFKKPFSLQEIGCPICSHFSFKSLSWKKKVINRPLKPWYLYDLRSNLMGFLVVAITLRLKPWQRRIDWMKATSSRREFKSSPFCVGKYGLMIKWLHTKIWLISICEDMDLLRRNMIFAVKKYCRSLIWIPRRAISRRHIMIFSQISRWFVSTFRFAVGILGSLGSKKRWILWLPKMQPKPRCGAFAEKDRCLVKLI